MSQTVSKIAKLLADVETVAELNLVIECVKQTRSDIKVAANRNARATMSAGDKVKITSKGTVEFGTIIKVNRSKAIVNINGDRWNVPLSIMEVV